MASIIVPSRRPWTAQPPASARLDERRVKYIGVYSGQHGTINLATGQALTRGSAVAVRPQKTGMAANQTVVNAGLWCPTRNIASVNAKYIALWHGVFVGAVVGSSPKLVGVSDSTTSQSTDLVGLERATNDQIIVTAKVAGIYIGRTFSVSSSGWYGKTVTLIGFYEISTQLVWLYVNVDGVITKYSATVSFSGDPAPTIPSTAQFVVGTDVVENPTRSPNVHTALAACFYGSVHNAWLEEKARNPWSIFAPRRIDTFVPLSGGGSTLAIAKIFQSHALDGLTLTAHSELAVTDANHGQTLDAIGLSASSLLAVVDASHDHLAENVALNTTGSENLIVLDSLHSHVADGVALTTQWLISVADALNSQSLESLTLSLDSHLAVADAGHGHASENMTLGVAGADNLVVSDVLHGQTAEGLALVTEWLLIVADAAHAQLADSVSPTTDTLLAVQEVIHGQSEENVALDTSDATPLTAQDAAHGHATDSLSLTIDTWLAIVGAAHAHAADTPTLSTETALQIAKALHARYADTVVLSFPGVTTLTPDDISAIAAAVLASLQATTIPVDAVTGAWPTAVENADALLSRTWP